MTMPTLPGAERIAALAEAGFHRLLHGNKRLWRTVRRGRKRRRRFLRFECAVRPHEIAAGRWDAPTPAELAAFDAATDETLNRAILRAPETLAGLTRAADYRARAPEIARIIGIDVDDVGTPVEADALVRTLVADLPRLRRRKYDVRRTATTLTRFVETRSRLNAG